MSSAHRKLKLAQRDRAEEILRQAGLRPTRQRVALTMLIFGRDGRHISADGLYAEVLRAGIGASLSCVYNSLRRFHAIGMIRKVPVYGATAYYDTNLGAHHHFHVEDDDVLIDVPGDEIVLGPLPTPPQGYRLVGAELVLRLRRAERPSAASARR